MNKKQKTLTLLAVAAFALTALFAPWDLTGSPNHTNVLRYAPLFAPPSLDVWSKRELASGIFWSWLALAVIYIGLFVALRQASPSLQTRRDEQLSHA
jgi:hypothetical protein